jgi:hypothetical protein
MIIPGYTQPDTCLIGGRYYLKSCPNGNANRFSEVTFVGYRPHPGEVVVDDGSGPRVVHRLYLYVSKQPEARGSTTGDDSER